MLKAIFGAQVFGVPQTSVAEDKPPSPAASPAPSRGIDVKTAVDAHVRWRHRLEEFIKGTGKETLVLEIVAADNHCDLGHWIHSEGRSRYGQLDLFVELETAHAEFHKQAGEVLAAAMRGQREDALSKLQTGAYPRASGRVKSLLAKLYVEVLCAENPVAGHIDPHPPATHR